MKKKENMEEKRSGKGEGERRKNKLIFKYFVPIENSIINFIKT